MADFTHPIPVVVCGKSEVVGAKVTESLKPEIEVIYFLSGDEQIQRHLPQLLAGASGANLPPSAVGTQNFSRLPQAVIFGRGNEPGSVQAHHASFGQNSDRAVAWIAGDPDEPPPTTAPGPGYAEKTAEVVKAKLAAWVKAGGKSRELIYY
ncbi:hypothetical protein F4777DRAFT_447279 [Nemania sp. FL0916]|nr:hypothetical protein F4777DRAFT_447279 [Nemania sp. FL0916]